MGVSTTGCSSDIKLTIMRSCAVGIWSMPRKRGFIVPAAWSARTVREGEGVDDGLEGTNQATERHVALEPWMVSPSRPLLEPSDR